MSETSRVWLSEGDACAYLRAAGWRRLLANWWRVPVGHEVTAEEMEAVRYLVYEHDYPGFEDRYMREGAADFETGLPRGANRYELTYDGGVPHRRWLYGWENARQ
jgi:hypothetical protein